MGGMVPGAAPAPAAPEVSSGWGIKRCFSGVQLISCPPHMARFLSSSLILVLHQPGTACRSVHFLAVGTPVALLAPLPAKTVQVPAHVKTMFVVEGNSQRQGNKKKRNCIKQKGKRVRKKLLREEEGYSFKKGCREGDSEERLEELRMRVRQRDGRAMEILDLSTRRNKTIIDICISQPQKS